MAHVTLIALGLELSSSSEPRLLPFRNGFEAAGHVVDVMIMNPETGLATARRVPGLADVAVRGLRLATGEIVLLVDLGRPYTVDDALAVTLPLAEGRAEIAVGCPGKPTISSKILAPLARTTDPWSGLVGLRRDAFARADGRVRPVGERFALEIVQRIEAERVDVVLPDRPGDSPRRWHFDDIRHLKRLADDRLGILSRLMQFCVVGASGMVVDLSCYAALQWELKVTRLAEMTLPIIGSSLDLAVAGLVSVTLALLWNFSLNRRLTFNDAKKSSVVGQFVTYVLSNALGITLSLTLRLALPRWFEFFDRHRLAAAVVGIVASTGVSFTMARWLVFPNERKAVESENSDSQSVPNDSSLMTEPTDSSAPQSASARVG